MGLTNLRLSLEEKYATWKGERTKLDAEIKKIIAAADTLPEKHRRKERLRLLLECAETIFSEIHPTWRPENVKGKQAKAYGLPFEMGTASRESLDILRKSPVPLTSQAVARQLLANHGISDTDRVLLSKVKGAIDANFRQHRGRFTQSSDDYQAKWSIMPIDGNKPD